MQLLLESSQSTKWRITMENEVFRIALAADFPAEIHEGEIRASLGEINWEQLDRIGGDIAALAAKILKVDRDFLVEHKSFTIPVDGFSRASLSFSVDFSIPEKQQQIIGNATTAFMERALGENPTRDLFEGEELSAEIKSLVVEHTSQFIEKNGDKKIVAPFLIETSFGTVKFCKGTFAKKQSSDPMAGSANLFHVGIISNMSWPAKAFKVKRTTSDEVELYYEGEIFFPGLCDIFKSHDMKTFVTKWKPQLKKAPIQVLIEIRPYEVPSENPNLELQLVSP